MSRRFMTCLDAKNLTQKHLNIKFKILYQFVKQIQRRIQHKATIVCDEFDLLWQCPPSLNGYPVYDPNEMTKRVMKHFQKQGFYIRQISATSLFISWR
jgi:hypothetical protein